MTVTKEKEEYVLCSSIQTDGEPVRAIAHSTRTASASSSNGWLVSGTEGMVLSYTDLSSMDSNVLAESTKHEHHVSALIAIPNNGAGSDLSYTGGYVSGCKDSLIRVFDEEHRLVRTLTGHGKAVTSLSWLNLPQSNMAVLISGSWDGTARLWNVSDGRCLATMDGHENTVSVQALPPLDSSTARFATGSAGIATGNVIRDHTIRLWNVKFSGAGAAMALSVGVAATVANDHDGPIRGLAFDVDTAMLLSCSNDGTVKIRDSSSGECVLTLNTQPITSNQQSPPMLLDVVSLGPGKVAACSEDGNAFLWDISNTTNTTTNNNNTDSPQIIPHPNTLWKLQVLPNKDLVTACHDGIIRLFTNDLQRSASPQDIATFHDAVAEARAKKTSGPSDDEIAKLPSWDNRAGNFGTSDNQVQVFRKGTKAIAAQWSATSQTWIEVGVVMGKSDDSGTVDGVRYDHIFPIEIDLPAGGVQTLQIGYNNGENPFVTAQAFIDRHMLDQNYLAQIADYIRQRVGEGSVPTLGPTDSTAAAATRIDVDIPAPVYNELPMVGYKMFDSGADSKTLKKIMAKIQEFNTELHTVDNNTTLSAADIQAMEKLCSTLSATSRYHASSISDAELNIIYKMLTGWSLSYAFPALDLARLTVLHPDASKSSRNIYWDRIVQATLQKCHEYNESGTTQSSFVIPMLSVRLFANCFRGGNGSLGSIKTHLSNVLACVDAFSLTTSKHVRLAVATVLLNASSYLKHTPGSCAEVDAGTILSIVGKIVTSEIYETEATSRVFVALGTLMLADEKFVIKVKELQLGSIVQENANRHGSKVIAVAKEIQMILT